jgi:hypothetical protein
LLLSLSGWRLHRRRKAVLALERLLLAADKAEVVVDAVVPR